MGDITLRGNSQLQPQRIDYRADGFVSGMGAGRDSLVQAFPPQLRLLGDLDYGDSALNLQVTARLHRLDEWLNPIPVGFSTFP
ncbi:MAG: hypothetical protein HQL39_01170 [Alphaproteobacteria bacterium]|nr:hypothetical protein [Alphaproteobacteria bacterium]